MGISGRVVKESLLPFLQHQILDLGESAVLITITFKKCESINCIFFQNVLAIVGSLHFHMKFIIGLAISS